MMLKSKLATFAGALILAGSAFAGQDGLCPDINDIKAAGIAMAEDIGPNVYITYNISNYNTPTQWGFVIAPVQGENNKKAVATANEILGTLTAQGVPKQQGGALICDYDTGRQDLFAAAIRDEGQISPMRLKQLYKSAH